MLVWKVEETQLSGIVNTKICIIFMPILQITIFCNIQCFMQKQLNDIKNVLCWKFTVFLFLLFQKIICSDFTLIIFLFLWVGFIRLVRILMLKCKCWSIFNMQVKYRLWHCSNIQCRRKIPIYWLESISYMRVFQVLQWETRFHNFA